MIPPLIERFRALSPSARTAFLDGLSPGAISDLHYLWEEAWARGDQIVSVAELERHPLVVFGGPRGSGKTRAAVQLWLREINSGRVRRPRIVAGTEADIDGTVVHGVSGVMACSPPDLRPAWIKTEGPSGVLRFRNGITAICFSAKQEEQIVGSAGDCDLLDDVAKWGNRAEAVWNHARVSCRLGRMTAIVATTRRGTTLLRKILKGNTRGVLVRRPDDTQINRFNVAAGHHQQMQDELGGSDFWRQEGDDEDISVSSPFAGLDFDAPPIRILEAPRSDFAEIVVIIDPADGKGGDHDEWGIGAAGRRHDRHVVALEDASGSYDDDEAADKALELCERWGAVKVVGEGNRGVARIQTVLRAAYYKRELERGGNRRPLPELVPVTARDGKKLRAGPLRALYLQGMLHHVAGLPVLERQQREWDPDGPKRPRQDDRIDWLVHAVHHLADLSDLQDDPGAQLTGLAERVQQMQAAKEPVGLQRAPGLPSYDQRSPGYGARAGITGLGGKRVL
jgi:phage terminase large subunit-like protein